jgi:hypothetical protein
LSGHPLGASGARILAHLAYQLRNNSKRYAVGSACIGGGQGTWFLFNSFLFDNRIIRYSTFDELIIFFVTYF